MAGSCAAVSPPLSSLAGWFTAPDGCARTIVGPTFRSGVTDEDIERRESKRRVAPPGAEEAAGCRCAHARRTLRLRQRLPRPPLSQSSPAVSLSLDDLAPGAGPDRGPATGGALLAHTMAGLLDGRRALTHPPCSFAPFGMVNHVPVLKEFYAEG